MICPESRLFDIIPIAPVRDPDQKFMAALWPNPYQPCHMNGCRWI